VYKGKKLDITKIPENHKVVCGTLGSVEAVTSLPPEWKVAIVSSSKVKIEDDRTRDSSKIRDVYGYLYKRGLVSGSVAGVCPALHKVVSLADQGPTEQTDVKVISDEVEEIIDDLPDEETSASELPDSDNPKGETEISQSEDLPDLPDGDGNA
jgi:hypothetical protein